MFYFIQSISQFFTFCFTNWQVLVALAALMAVASSSPIYGYDNGLGYGAYSLYNGGVTHGIGSYGGHGFHGNGGYRGALPYGGYGYGGLGFLG